MATARTSGSPAPSDAGQSTAQMPRDATCHATIPVSKPQSELLDNNDVAETFLNTLEKHGITVEPSTLHTECISVTEGDPEVAKQCLTSVVDTQTVTLEAGDSEVSSLLLGLLHKFRSRFAVHFGQGVAEVAFLHSIRPEVLSVLEEIKTARKLVPLPCYLASFIQRHLQSFKVNFNSNFHVPFDISVTTDPSNQPCLQLKGERASIPVAQSVLEKMVALIYNRQMDASRSRGLYLESPAGRKHAHGIEENSCCTISVEMSDERVLLSARSPQGHEVMLCEGNLRTTDCHVVVLPLCDGQAEWSPSHKYILERGGCKKAMFFQVCCCWWWCCCCCCCYCCFVVVAATVVVLVLLWWWWK